MMLNVPTLWTAFVVNFLALGLIWAFVMRSYPAFEAARFWTASAFAAAAGAGVSMLLMVTDSLIPLLVGGTVMILSGCLATMGIERFYDSPVSWRGTALITGLSFAGIAFSCSAMTTRRCGSRSIRPAKSCRWRCRSDC